MTWAQALREATLRLGAAGIADPARDARALLAHAMGVGRERLMLHLDEATAPDVLARFDSMITARAARVPVSHLTGKRLFWGRSFAVTPQVLDPRPETETLVALALAEPSARMLDLGTGSGCILISVLADQGQGTGLGVDLSPAAVRIAQGNALALGVADRASFGVSDWCAAVVGRFDLIVSNPPYISAAELPDLAPEVRGHERHLALTDYADGLTAYRAIAGQAPAHLASHGRLLVEIGPTQGAAVAALLRGAGLVDVGIHRDLDGRDRVVSACAP